MRWLNDISKHFLGQDYLSEGETVEERLDVIARTAETYLGIDGYADKFLDYMSKGYYSLSSPIWSNYGKKRGEPVSCFGSSIEDNIGNILFTQSEVGVMSKLGGGTSGYFGHLRERGSPITDNGHSSGAVHFMQLFQSIVDVISQGSVRRGRFSPYLPVEHKDINEFLDIGTEGNVIQDLTHGVTVTDQWLEEMIAGDYEKRKIWGKVLKRRSEIGYPYIMFTDTVNNNKPDVYKDKNMDVKASNLCVAGDTRVLTCEGYKEIKTLAGKTVTCWNGFEWSNTTFEQTSEGQAVVDVELSTGIVIKATPYHKWFIQVGNEEVIKRTHELKPNDVILSHLLEPVTHGDKELEDAYNKGKGLETLEVPSSEYTLESRVEWFLGFMDKKSVSCHKEDDYYVLETTYNEGDILKEIQLLLQETGIYSRLSTEDTDNDQLTLTVTPSGINALLDLGFEIGNGHIPYQENDVTDVDQTTVVGVEDRGEIIPTYCGHEPLRNKLMFEGVITSNCSEIALPANDKESFVCVLSSMNLLHYDEWKDTDAVETMVYFLDSVVTEFVSKLEAYRDSDSLEDNQIFQFMEKAYNFAKNHRALGLGVLGWHSYLQSKMIPFESRESSKLNYEIFKLIQERSYKASEELASKYGEPAVLEGYGRRNATLNAIAPTTSSAFILGQVSQSIEPLMSNYYVKDLAKMKVSIKNVYLEKLLIDKYDKNTREVWNSILERDGSVQHLDFLTQEEKDVFKTYTEISQDYIIETAGIRQEFIDQSQSLNLMIHPSLSAKEINELHLKAWRMGVKSLYYQHSINAAQAFNQNKTCVACEA